MNVIKRHGIEWTFNSSNVTATVEHFSIELYCGYDSNDVAYWEVCIVDTHAVPGHDDIIIHNTWYGSLQDLMKFTADTVVAARACTTV